MSCLITTIIIIPLCIKNIPNTTMNQINNIVMLPSISTTTGKKKKKKLTKCSNHTRRGSSTCGTISHSLTLA